MRKTAPALAPTRTPSAAPVCMLACALAFALSGCATPASPYGNFVQTVAAERQQQLADAAAQRLAALYLPAKTRLELQQPTPDAFGQFLVKALRDKGYALQEFDPAGAKAQAPQAPQALASAPTDVAGAPATPAVLPLRYVLDQATYSNLYRLTLLVGDQSLTRPYLEANGAFTPAGYWVRKE
ncbi:conjugal transfer protein TrbH [Ramlibacter sp. H39-3-26]|uniref:conjugal transfer protein TrbH n=1 Tax=Curvibacter soli TaxID=3031331 RepID=UPI0023DB0D7B|nr:conjugal transfer protein TrbH [Ramlibacter sp. H39-3-26]MDF1486018.1 conjugal transfer protein TrbH [Ramlibacter sp. H39-3-26]